VLRHYLRRAAQTLTEFAYARRQYKLLLRTTLSDLDLRTQAVAAATNFFSTAVKPIVIAAPFGESMLVVAPHQDDEVIGCGGAMALQRRAGRSVKAVVLQDGADEHGQVSMTRLALSERRNAESRAAARVIEAEEPTFLGSGNLRRDTESIAARLGELIDSRRIDCLFTPFILDGHPDHRACNAILAKALVNVNRKIRILQYEVWANCIPNVIVIIDEVVAQKEQMLGCFEFANAAVDYTHATLGLNRFHSRLLPAGRARFIEAYFESPLAEYLQIVKAVEAAERRSQSSSPEVGGT
jgi:N-acetylglucosamine malate deacetylase 1